MMEDRFFMGQNVTSESIGIQPMQRLQKFTVNKYDCKYKKYHTYVNNY